MNRKSMEAAVIFALLSGEVDKRLIKKDSFFFYNKELSSILDNDISHGIFKDIFPDSYEEIIETNKSLSYSIKELEFFIKKSNKSLFINELQRKVKYIGSQEEITYEEISNVLRPFSYGTDDLVTVKSSTELLKAVIEDLVTDRDSSTDCLRSSLTTLNNVFGGGFRKGNNYVIGARPGAGKTTLACQLILDFNNVNLNKEKPLIVFWTLEVPSKNIIIKMLSNLLKIPFNDILTKKNINKAELIDRINQHKKLIEELDVQYIDKITTPNTIYKKGMEVADKDRTVVHILDHTTLASGDAIDQRQTVVDVLRAFQHLKKETNSTNIIISHVKRSADEKERKSELYEPRISDLVWSSEIEQIADVIMFLHDPSKFNISIFEGITTKNMIFGLVKKNRYNKLGIIPFVNDLSVNKISNYQQNELL